MCCCCDLQCFIANCISMQRLSMRYSHNITQLNCNACLRNPTLYATTQHETSCPVKLLVAFLALALDLVLLQPVALTAHCLWLQVRCTAHDCSLTNKVQTHADRTHDSKVYQRNPSIHFATAILQETSHLVNQLKHLLVNGCQDNWQPATAVAVPATAGNMV